MPQSKNTYWEQVMNHVMQSTSHSTTSQRITPFAQLQFPQLTLHQQQLMQVLPYGASKAFCLNILRAEQIDFLNLGSVVYCTSLQLILQFQARRLFGFEHLSVNRV